jgi:hypothetical protein
LWDDVQKQRGHVDVPYLAVKRHCVADWDDLSTADNICTGPAVLIFPLVVVKINPVTVSPPGGPEN